MHFVLTKMLEIGQAASLPAEIFLYSQQNIRRITQILAENLSLTKTCVRDHIGVK